jgi:hypothetical protein
MKGHRHVYIYWLQSSVNYSLVRGDAELRDWLLEHNIPAMWTPRHRGWSIRTERMADLVAQAEHDGLQVQMKGQL